MKDLGAGSAPAGASGATPGQPVSKTGGDRGPARELPPDTPPMQAGCTPDTGQARPDAGPLRYLNAAVTAPTEGKSRLLSMTDLDRRSAAYRETARLISEIESDLGGHDQLSAAEKQMIQHGAILGAVLGDMGAKYLKGRTIDPMSFCSVANAQRRLFETLGTKRRPRDVTPSVEQYLDGLQRPPAPTDDRD